MEKKISKLNLLIIVLISFVAIIYISLIFNDSVWSDEAYTMITLKKNYIDIIKSTAQDVHPPLYYIIAKIFTLIFGYSVSSVKLASITPVILVMIFVKNKADKLFKDNSKLITILFILLIGFCPKAFSMNIELRMYTWAMFFVTCSGVYAYELYKNPQNIKTLCLFVLSSLAAAYTHYYAALTECFIYLFLLINLLLLDRKNWRLCMIFIITTIIGYIPWLPIFIRQFSTVRDGWWLTTFSVNSILHFIKYLFEGNFTNIFLILFASSIVGLLFHINSKKNNTDSWFALFSIFSFMMTVLVGYIVSLLIRPMFIDRYMYPGVGLLFLGVSIAVCQSEYKNLLKDMFIALIILNLPFSYNTEYIKEYKTGTEKFKQFVQTNISVDDKISTDISQLSWTILPYYLPNNKISGQINKNSNGYVMTNKKIEEVKKILSNTNVNLVFSGDIDSKYKFNVYYVE